jgi:thiamine-phosphate pyrophosphorylase
VGIGAVFPSKVKPDAVCAPLEMLGEAKRRFGLPVAAIGGVTLSNAPEAIAAGADMVALITDLFDAMDISARAEAFQNLFFANQP